MYNENISTYNRIIINTQTDYKQRKCIYMWDVFVPETDKQKVK